MKEDRDASVGAIQNTAYELLESVAVDVIEDIDLDEVDDDELETAIRYIVERYVMSSYVSAMVIDAVSKFDMSIIDRCYTDDSFAKSFLFSIVEVVADGITGIVDACVHWRESSIDSIVEEIGGLDICQELIDAVKSTGITKSRAGSVPKSIIDEIAKIVGVSSDDIKDAVMRQNVMETDDGYKIGFVAIPLNDSEDEVDHDDTETNDDEESIDDFWSSL